MKSHRSVVCLLIIFGLAMGVKKMLHPSIIVCKRNDPNLSKCIKENFERLLPFTKNGIPEMNIVPVEPVHVENVRMNFPATRSVSLGADLMNMNVWGISNLVLKEVITTKSPTNTLSTYMHFNIPKMSLGSDYKAIGKFLLINIDAVGNFTGEFEDIDITMNWSSEQFEKKGKAYFKWDTRIDKMTIGKMKMNLNNLFGNNTELTENINKVINENINELYDEVAPVVKETVISVVKSAINNVYGLFPADVLHPIN